eukprot:TRINITY_DN2263_c0_g1_i1.p1 TRINITY_DN2263_c0_g1~~TRINITY_DN2263_c0_g1_i1.p1  ORF type:complete len:662 (+),score=198.86 TRINITY_DN2263_c0_g1_i1:62-2047(+)
MDTFEDELQNFLIKYEELCEKYETTTDEWFLRYCLWKVDKNNSVINNIIILDVHETPYSFNLYRIADNHLMIIIETLIRTKFGNRLTSLQFRECIFNEECIKKLCILLKNNISLKYLQFVNSSNGFYLLSGLVDNLKENENKSLENLAFNNMNLSSRDNKTTFALLLSLILKFENLKLFDLSNIPLKVVVNDKDDSLPLSKNQLIDLLKSCANYWIVETNNYHCFCDINANCLNSSAIASLLSALRSKSNQITTFNIIGNPISLKGLRMIFSIAIGTNLKNFSCSLPFPGMPQMKLSNSKNNRNKIDVRQWLNEFAELLEDETLGKLLIDFDFATLVPKLRLKHRSPIRSQKVKPINDKSKNKGKKVSESQVSQQDSPEKKNSKVEKVSEKKNVGPGISFPKAEMSSRIAKKQEFVESAREDLKNVTEKSKRNSQNDGNLSLSSPSRTQSKIPQPIYYDSAEIESVTTPKLKVVDWHDDDDYSQDDSEYESSEEEFLTAQIQLGDLFAKPDDNGTSPSYNIETMSSDEIEDLLKKLKTDIETSEAQTEELAIIEKKLNLFSEKWDTKAMNKKNFLLLNNSHNNILKLMENLQKLKTEKKFELEKIQKNVFYKKLKKTSQLRNTNDINVESKTQGLLGKEKVSFLRMKQVELLAKFQSLKDN